MRAWLSMGYPSVVLRTFFAGLLALLPIILTIVIINWLVGQARSMFGPGSLLGDALATGTSVFFGADRDQLAFWIGVLIVVVGIWAIGLAVSLQARKTLTSALDSLFNRIPLLRTIYRPVAQVVRLLDTESEGEFKGMQVVSVRLNEIPGVDTLALRASRQSFEVDGEQRALIYVPTAPIPMGGFLLLVAVDSITTVPGMSVDDLMKVYFSIGALAPEGMPKSI